MGAPAAHAEEEQVMAWTEEDVWNKRHDLLRWCRLSRAYHQKRERFFDILDNSTKALSVLGATAIYPKVVPPGYQAYIAAIVAITSTLSLVLGYAKRSRAHADLAKTFVDIESRIIAKGIFDDAVADAFEAEIVKAEGSEPRALGALVRICQNEILAAEGNGSAIRPLRVHQRLFAHFYDFDLSDDKKKRYSLPTVLLVATAAAAGFMAQQVLPK